MLARSTHLCTGHIPRLPPPYSPLRPASPTTAPLKIVAHGVHRLRYPKGWTDGELNNREAGSVAGKQPSQPA